MGLGNNVRAAEVETVNSKKRQKKFFVDTKILDLKLSGKDEMGEQFLTLRSGKNVVKREIKTDTCAGNLLGGTESGKESEIELSHNIVKTRSRASMKEVDDEGCMERKFTRAIKGKGKAGRETSVIGSSLSLNLKVDNRVGLTIGASKSDAFSLPKSSDSDDVNEDKTAVRT